MNLTSRLNLAAKAFIQLGPRQTGLYGLYRLGLRSGHYRRALSRSLARLDKLNQSTSLSIQHPLPPLPERDQMLDLLGDQISKLYGEADEILDGSVRLFGGKLAPLELSVAGKAEYWTKYAGGEATDTRQDIKLIWEPGRFGWAYKLAMAYHLSQDERYAEGFWHYTGLFLNSNLPYDGPHWSSAQEAAIRLVALAFCMQAFGGSKHTTPERSASMARALAVHAERIPPTLVYSRAQTNNHLICEALGLYTASAVLPEHPLAARWHNSGWKWLNHAFRRQITPDGTYIQHSTNYHRLMLQAALWMVAIHEHAFSHEEFPPDVRARLEAAMRWLWKLVDPESGRVPNLGHNDGAYILPLTTSPYQDYRPVIHAAGRQLLHINLTPHGAWEDMAAWIGVQATHDLPEREFSYWHQSPTPEGLNIQPPYLLVNHQNGSWGSIRVATFRSRPAHADQLHLDLWWQGDNIAQDPGTYLYNSDPPWENSLTSSLVHNTVTVDGRECMRRVDRFLYLDWAQGKVTSYQPATGNIPTSLAAEHNGYRKIGVAHGRKVVLQPDGSWEIIDRLSGASGLPHTVRLQWLLPDWEYEVLGPTQENGSELYVVRMRSPKGWISLKIGAQQPAQASQPMKIQLVRAGRVLFGNGEGLSIAGWASPTYGEKNPALACICEVTQVLPVELKSVWSFPSETQSSGDTDPER